MRAITHNRAWLLVLCVTTVSLYSSIYIAHSLSLVLIVTVARWSIALLAGLAVSIMMTTVVAITG